ncbi:MAG TPA: hypothetical protein PKE65_05565 [Rhizobiaceae bacterium]|nr:hypothetical protein [Rhizobiaceae bacterium]
MIRVLQIVLAVTLTASATAPAAHATNGINALVAVSQLKAQNANEEALNDAEERKAQSKQVRGQAEKRRKDLMRNRGG